MIAVSKAFFQIQLVLRSEPLEGAGFCISAHVFAREPAGPVAIECIRLAGYNFNGTREMLCDGTRERGECAGDKKHAMPLCVVPGKPR